MLADYDITRAIRNREIILSPYDPDLVQPSSVDVCLDYRFLVPDNNGGAVDPQRPTHSWAVEVPQGQPFELGPGEFVLGSTYESLTLDERIAARLEGKSSLGRLGLLTHATAGFIDPGFSGNITLELANLSPRPLLLWPGMKIGQLCFFRLDSTPLRTYGDKAVGSHYQGQQGPTESRSWDGFQLADVY